MNKAYASAIIAALSLAACQQAKHEPAAESSAAGPAARPDAKPGIALADGKFVLPAVAGNPGAAYFKINNQAGASVVIAGIAIDGAEKTEVHQTMGTAMNMVDSVEIAPGTSITFEPGKLHVMAFKLAPTLRPGGTTEVTVTFADGDKVSAPMKIEAAGGGGGDDAMGGMGKM